MNVSEAIEYIHSVYWKGSIYGLSRIQALLEKLGNPQDSMKYVHKRQRLHCCHDSLYLA